MSNNFETKSFSAGTNLFLEGDKGDSVYIVTSGRVKIWRNNNGQEQVFGYIDKDGIFGEMALINDKPRIANASAEGDVTCQVVSRAEFQQKLDSMNTFVRTLVKILATNIRSLSYQIDSKK